MNKMKKGDSIIVIAGKDKGKRGTVTNVLNNGYVLVDGINVARKHTKANPNTNDRGGIMMKSMPIHRSNVMHYDSGSGKASRVGVRALKDGTRVRYFKGTDENLDV